MIKETVQTQVKMLLRKILICTSAFLQEPIKQFMVSSTLLCLNIETSKTY